MSISNRQILNNISVSLLAQIVSLCVSLIINLVVPKFIPLLDYSKWHVYILYAGFVGLFHIGLLDGFILKYSSYDYDKLDKRIVKFHFVSLFLVILAAALIVLCVGILSTSIDSTIIVLVSIAVIVKNLYVFTQYSYQATNRIRIYAKVIIFQRLVYALLIIGLLVIDEYNFVYFCIADLLADFLGFVLSAIFNKDIYYAKLKVTKEQIAIVTNTVACGFIMMIANFSNNFIVGACKIAIESQWSKEIFGKTAFAFSITNLFLSFVMAISVVLFPSIKRLDKEKLQDFYYSMRIVLTELLYVAFIVYYPCVALMETWVPNYSDSFVYLNFLFPIILYSTCTSLLINNYLKAYRKEMYMLVVNIGSVVIEVLGLCILIYFNSIPLILLLTVIVTMIKAVISESIVCKILHINCKSLVIQEIIISISFVLSLLILPPFTH